MTLLFSGIPEPLPTTLRNKTWVMNTIKTKAPLGKKSYEWWLNFFQTVMRDQWDAS